MTDKPIWKKPWVWVPAVITGFAAVLTATLSILSSARALPTEWQKTSDQFLSWYHDDKAWKGYWTTNAEGYADLAEMKLTNGNFYIKIDDANHGQLSGTISTQSICDNVPVFEELLIEGDVSGSDVANVSVWDLIGGYRRVFATLKIERDDYIMTVSAKDDPAGLFPKPYRIARDPNEFKGGETEEFCTGKLRKMIKSMENMQKSRKLSGQPSS